MLSYGQLHLNTFDRFMTERVAPKINPLTDAGNALCLTAALLAAQVAMFGWLHVVTTLDSTRPNSAISVSTQPDRPDSTAISASGLGL
jgi:hypothetical protein